MKVGLGTYLAITLIFLSFVAFALMARKPLCIDSKVVDKIDKISATSLDGPSSLYRCSMRRYIPYNETWALLIPHINQSLRGVERLTESLKPFEEHIKIVLSEKKPKVFKINGHEITIGIDLIAQEGVLEKALLKVWYNENASPFSKDHPLLAESVTDLLYFSIAGSAGDVNEIESELSHAKWPFVAMNVTAYCRSGWVQLEYLEFCSEFNQRKHTSIENKNSLVAGSLRPLFTKSLLEAYMKLPQSDRRKLLMSLPTFLEDLNFFETGVGFTSLRVSQQSLVDLASELSLVVRNIESHAKQGFQKKWIREIEMHLSERGFSEEPLAANVDLLIVLKGLMGKDFFGSKIWSTISHLDSKKTILGYDAENLFLLPNVEPLDKTTLGHVLAQQLIYIHCGSLNISDLEPYFNSSSRLMVIQSCDPYQAIRVDFYVSGGAIEFAQKNPNIKFIEIHLPSLVMAIKQKKLHINQNLSVAESAKKIFETQLGWKTSDFDSNTKVYVIQSEIEAIRSYRP